tara:strand:- start:475 stop:1191 length:717 start_codon:yes stop_codon:yes gene_type:complete
LKAHRVQADGTLYKGQHAGQTYKGNQCPRDDCEFSADHYDQWEDWDGNADWPVDLPLPQGAPLPIEDLARPPNVHWYKFKNSGIEDCLSFATIELPTIVLNEEGDHFVAATPKVFDYETIKYQYTNMIETNQPITISCYDGENVVGDQTKVSFTHFMVLSRRQWEQLGCRSTDCVGKVYKRGSCWVVERMSIPNQPEEDEAMNQPKEDEAMNQPEEYGPMGDDEPTIGGLMASLKLKF